MRLLTLLLSLSLLATPLRAGCEGTDLIAAMTEEQRAPLKAQADAVPYGTGLLWQAVRGETRMVIFGTYHLRHDLTEAHAEALAPHIAAADIAWFEASAADQAAAQRAMASEPALIFLTEGPTMPDLLGPQDWARYTAEMQARGIPGFMAAKFKPMMGVMMLGMGPCLARSGVLQEQGIDKVLALRAVAAGVPDRSLEDFRVPLRLLDAFPLDEQIEALRLSFAYTDRADDLHHTLLARYLAGEVALIWEYSRALTLDSGGPGAAEDFAALEDLLLTQRNRAWVDLLLAEAEGRRSFIAVGAGHLPYDFGLLSLLAAQGFEITPLPFP